MPKWRLSFPTHDLEADELAAVWLCQILLHPAERYYGDGIGSEAQYSLATSDC